MNRIDIKITRKELINFNEYMKTVKHIEYYIYRCAINNGIAYDSLRIWGISDEDLLFLKLKYESY